MNRIKLYSVLGFFVFGLIGLSIGIRIYGSADSAGRYVWLVALVTALFGIAVSILFARWMNSRGGQILEHFSPKLTKDQVTIAFTLVFIIFIILALNDPFKSILQTSNGSVYSNSTYNFKITPPTGWVINSNPKNLENAVVVFSDSSVPSDHPVINLELVPSGNLNLDDYVNAAIDQSKGFDNFSLIKKEKFGTGSNSYYLIEISLSNSTIGSIHCLELFRQETNGKFFLIVGESNASVWDKYSTIIKNSLLSFTY